MIGAIEQSALSVERMMFAQAKKIKGLIKSVILSGDFCEYAVF